MKAPNSTVLGIAIVMVSVAFGVAVMLDTAENPPEPKAKTVPSRTTIERQLREGKVLAGEQATPFRLRHSDEWVEVERHQLPKTEPSPLAGLRRTNYSALLTVSVDGPVDDLERLERETRERADDTTQDLKLRTVRRVTVAAGPALYASYERKKSGQIQTALIVPDDDRSFRVDAVVRPGARDAAAQLGAMLRTFDVAAP